MAPHLARLPAVTGQGQATGSIHRDALGAQQLGLDPVAALAAGGEAD
jgi:hypothetical protein